MRLSISGGLLAVLPVTTADRRLPLHLEVRPPEGGFDEVSFVMVDQIRTISARRVRQTIGRLGPHAMKAVDDLLRIVLDLE